LPLLYSISIIEERGLLSVDALLVRRQVVSTRDTVGSGLDAGGSILVNSVVKKGRPAESALLGAHVGGFKVALLAVLGGPTTAPVVLGAIALGAIGGLIASATKKE
jgi:hypothetical protein